MLMEEMAHKITSRQNEVKKKDFVTLFADFSVF